MNTREEGLFPRPRFTQSCCGRQWSLDEGGDRRVAGLETLDLPRACLYLETAQGCSHVDVSEFPILPYPLLKDGSILNEYFLHCKVLVRTDQPQTHTKKLMCSKLALTSTCLTEAMPHGSCGSGLAAPAVQPLPWTKSWGACFVPASHDWKSSWKLLVCTESFQNLSSMFSSKEMFPLNFFGPCSLQDGQRQHNRSVRGNIEPETACLSYGDDFFKV